MHSSRRLSILVGYHIMEIKAGEQVVYSYLKGRGYTTAANTLKSEARLPADLNSTTTIA